MKLRKGTVLVHCGAAHLIAQESNVMQLKLTVRGEGVELGDPTPLCSNSLIIIGASSLGEAPTSHSKWSGKAAKNVVSCYDKKNPLL